MRIAPLVLLAGLIASPALAATAVLPSTCNPNNPSDCVRAQPVVNPDGTTVGSGSGGNGLTNAQLRASPVPMIGVQGALTDASGAITTGGTAQQAIAANATRNYLYCQNPTTATEDLLVNIGATASAANSYDLAPGGTLTFSSGFIPTGLVSVLATTTGHVYVCKQG